jgi:hypothetical protein
MNTTRFSKTRYRSTHGYILAHQTVVRRRVRELVRTTEVDLRAGQQESFSLSLMRKRLNIHVYEMLRVIIASRGHHFAWRRDGDGG